MIDADWSGISVSGDMQPPTEAEIARLDTMRELAKAIVALAENLAPPQIVISGNTINGPSINAAKGRKK